MYVFVLEVFYLAAHLASANRFVFILFFIHLSKKERLEKSIDHSEYCNVFNTNIVGADEYNPI